MSDHQLKVPNINRVAIAGRLTRDPDLRYLKSGNPVCEFSVAVDDSYKAKGATEYTKRAVYVDVVCWGPSAEWAGKNARKATPVYIDGKLTTDEWEDKATGQKRSKLKVTAHSVQSLEWGTRSNSPYAESKAATKSAEQLAEENFNPDDDIQF